MPGNLPEPEYGAMSITLVDGGGAIFANTAETQTVWESHNDEVHVVPEGFFITASSDSCKVQGMENEEGTRFWFYNSIPRLMIQNLAKKCLRISLKFADVQNSLNPRRLQFD